MTLVRNNPLLIAITVLISIALSFWAVYVDPIINPDALIYLSAADEFKHGNFANAFELYKWPFYSFLIAGIEALLGVSAQNAAYTVNAIMHAFAMLGFLACVQALGGNKRTIIIAALVILFFPSFNKYRSFIIRDVGFLAFYLWSLYHLFLAVKIDQINRFIYAFILMVIATLFRIEGVALLVIVPSYLLYAKSNSKNARIFWLAVTIVGSLLLFFGISIWLFGGQAQGTQPGILGVIQGSMDQLTASLEFKLRVIRQQLLNEFSFKVAPAVLIITVICISIYEPLRRLAYIFAFFSWHALKKRLVLQNSETRHVFYVLCLIQLILLFLFTLINMFLVSRHTMALTLTILILAPFSLEYFYAKWKMRRDNHIGALRWTFPVLLVIFLGLAIDGLDLKTNKLEIKEAGKWLSTQVEDNSYIYSNDALILHYAGEEPAIYNLRFNWKELDQLLVTKRIFNFDYVAISINKNIDRTREYLSKKMNIEPFAEKTFVHDRVILIFDLREQKSSENLDSRYLKISR